VSSAVAKRNAAWSLTRASASRNLSVDGAKVLRLWQIGRGGRQTKWVNGSGRSFSNGRFD